MSDVLTDPVNTQVAGEMAITAEQCRMARAALNVDIRELSKATDLSPATIWRLERGDNVHRATAQIVQSFFEERGVEFSEAGDRVCVRITRRPLNSNPAVPAN